MVPSGCNSSATTAARWYKGSSLALDRMSLGGVRTYDANSLVSDSAQAATSFATGYKSSDKFVSVLPDSVTIPGVTAISENMKYKPAASVLEGAKLLGKSVGLVATSSIQNGAPAAFSAHWPDRSDFNDIGEQQVYLGIDVVFGGGKKYLLPKEKGGTRVDGEDLIQVLRSRGYVLVENGRDMAQAKGKKIWGAFADDFMANEFDRRRERPQEPTLAEMTKKAIEILSKNPKGFFLFVEGSKVGSAAHAHDPVGVISEVLAFDDAVRVALDFAKKNKQTLVLAFTDQGTGGMSINGAAADRTYSKLPYDAVFGPLKKATLTVEGIERLLAGDSSEEKVRELVGKYYGIADLNPEEIKAVQKSRKSMNQVLGPMMSRRAHIGWSTAGHTGEDVFFYHYGYAKPLGMIENTEIAHMISKALGFDLKRTNYRLFAPADELFKGAGAVVSVDATDPENPVLIVEKAGRRAELPFSKNVIRVLPSAKEYAMEGLTILAPKTGKVYVPRQALTIFDRSKK